MAHPRLFLNTPVKSYIQVTNVCDLNCQQCYTNCSKEAPTDELTLDEWKQVLTQMSTDGVININIEGGEPLCRGDLDDFLRFATSKFWVWLRTHAHLITPKRAEELAKLGIGRVIVDLFAPHAELNDELAGVPGTYERTIEGVKNLRAYDVPVALACILNRKVLPRLQDYLDLGAELGAVEVAFLRFYPIGRALENWGDLAPTLPEIMTAVDSVVVPDGVRFMEGFHPYDSNCCFENAGVTSTGRSIGCPYLRDLVDFGNVRDRTLLDTWQDAHYTEIRTAEVEGACDDCAGTQVGSPGGCRSAAFMFKGSWDASDPFCVNMSEGVDVSKPPTYLPLTTP